MPPTKVSSEWSQELVSRVTEEVDGLLQRHRVELSSCLEHWVWSVREPVEARQFAVNCPTADSSQQLAVVGGDAFGAKCFDSGIGLQPARELGDIDTKMYIADKQDTEQEELGRAPTPPQHTRAAHPAASGGPCTGRRNSLDSMKRYVAGTLSHANDRKQRRKRNSRTLFAMPLSVESSEPQTLVQRITSSRSYDLLSGTLICLNALFIGWQTQYLANAAIEAAAASRPLESEEPVGFLVLQILFTTLFTIELVPRWVGDGFIGFFLVHNRWWNLLDVGVVMLGWADLFIGIVIDRSDIHLNFSLVRVLRVIRVVRVVRIIRVLKFFRELRLMVYSILRSVKSLVWVMIVLALTLYIFGIIFTVGTYTALDRIEDWSSLETKDLRTYFSTLDRSCLSLFTVMTGGNDWYVYFAVLERLPFPFRVAFLVYISFGLFAVLNIVTGVFVDAALQSNSEDKLITAQEELEVKKEYLQAMRDIFEEMDDDDSGVVSLEQFETKLADDRVIAYFNAMGLNVTDARKLFGLLDCDKSNSVDIEEFVGGCYMLQGESRALDMKVMECEVHILRDHFAKLVTILERVEERVSRSSHIKAL